MCLTGSIYVDVEMHLHEESGTKVIATKTLGLDVRQNMRNVLNEVIIS
jgi:hypothetical protein